MSDDTRPYKGGFEAMYERMHGGTTMTYRLGQERADEDDHGQTDFRGELRECDKQVDALFVANSRQKEEIDRLKATVARVEAVAAEFEGMTGSGYRYMAAHVREAIKVPNAEVTSRPTQRAID